MEVRNAWKSWLAIGHGMRGLHLSDPSWKMRVCRSKLSATQGTTEVALSCGSYFVMRTASHVEVAYEVRERGVQTCDGIGRYTCGCRLLRSAAGKPRDCRGIAHPPWDRPSAVGSPVCRGIAHSPRHYIATVLCVYACVLCSASAALHAQCATSPAMDDYRPQCAAMCACAQRFSLPQRVLYILVLRELKRSVAWGVNLVCSVR